HPDAELMLIGEGPGSEEDRQGLPFVGPAGELLTKIIQAMEMKREDLYIANIVKCRPPGNRDPEPDEIAACAPYLQRQLEVLDPAVVVTLGRFSMGHFRPGERITQIHGTQAPAPDATGTRDAVAFALFHPAAALRSTEVERQSYEDIAGLPRVLEAARARRAPQPAGGMAPDAANTAVTTAAAAAADAVPQDAPEFVTMLDVEVADTLVDDGPTLFESEP
ncbi:MAG: uracil-DNA glycosylase, partial [Chloroflexota bacterium]